MPEALPHQRLIWYRDSTGRWSSVLVEASTARQIENLARRYRRADALYRKRHVLLSELSSEAGYELRPEEMEKALENRRLARREHGDQGSVWSGPRFQFSHMVGMTETWRGEPVVDGHCELCRNEPLPDETLCLGCNRSGEDRSIPTLSRAELQAMRRAMPKNDGRAGGRGKVPQAPGIQVDLTKPLPVGTGAKRRR